MSTTASLSSGQSPAKPDHKFSTSISTSTGKSLSSQRLSAYSTEPPSSGYRTVMLSERPASASYATQQARSRASAQLDAFTTQFRGN
ncbi:hypothetical protein JX265_004096 [Neoarthrinium moseri]|uniref:Uncharacterized protein n=1 Tax=Neoarthrinium moseri TaxID=1658444 RepID=A0A9P9WRJ8_9PEZI|nr:uncharacterized protein JN550_008718 [Neoarthrinium moseri]KAI1853573.1 hypothetical protein JX266_001557 [Neoarthrinium moseri]KAI1864898.1 hypothetical protein JN550_008718 [Neoarthrinium moseri]KAI1876570.1 hypothetical protein JX265_004096 [Neoarthrinium moseri]